jgi:hypothetical protein
MSEHTPLPWHFSRKYRYVSDINHRVIAEIAPLHAFQANAEFIVRAVNNHDALVEALQALVDNINDYERVNNLAPTPPRTECWDTVAHAKRVLDAILPTADDVRGILSAQTAPPESP